MLSLILREKRGRVVPVRSHSKVKLRKSRQASFIVTQCHNCHMTKAFSQDGSHCWLTFWVGVRTNSSLYATAGRSIGWRPGGEQNFSALVTTSVVPVLHGCCTGCHKGLFYSTVATRVTNAIVKKINHFCSALRHFLILNLVFSAYSRVGKF